MFEDIDDEVEWFDEPPSFNDLCGCLDGNFGGDFTLKGRFDSGETRAHYVVVPLRNPTDWSRYNGVLQKSNMTIPKVVVEKGTGWRTMSTGRTMTVLDTMNKKLGSKGKELRVIWI
jgi:hypothetical protein